MKPEPQLRPNQIALVVSLMATVACWFLGPLRIAMLPVLYLDTHLHELCHALTAVFTGGHVVDIAVNADGSGLTRIMGGSALLMVSAGYVGSTLFGAGMISCARNPKAARVVLAGLGLLIAGSMAFWVRSDVVGVISGMLWPVVLLVFAAKLKDVHALFATIFIGVELCLSSFMHLFALLNATIGTEQFSDAQTMQNLTMVPSIVWALSWCGFSAFLVWVTVRSVFRGPKSVKAVETPSI